MSMYELVVVIDPGTSQEVRDWVSADIEKMVWASSIKWTDDMWLVQFAYEMYRKKGLHQWFVTSYHLDIDSSDVTKITKELSYKKELLRCVFYAMKTNQEYLSLEDTAKKVESLVESDEWTMKKKLTLFKDWVNEEYLTWKAVPLLKKFMTRFGDIKPRKYTGITVAQQKRLRLAIQRARELWFIVYIK